MSDEVLRRATAAVERCLSVSGNGEVEPTRSIEFYAYVAGEVLAAVRRTSVHDRAVTALAAWLNGSDHEVENHLYVAAAAALRLLNREELGWLGVHLEDANELGSHTTGESQEAEVVTEYGQLYSGGSVLTWPRDPSGELERLWPLADRIANAREGGGTAMRRRVCVVTDWEAVTEP